MVAFWVFVGGGLGSLARFGIGKATSLIVSTSFPLGTFISNILACIILAVIVYLLPAKLIVEHSWLTPLMVIGFCGGFSTFSSFSYENVQLISNGNTGLAILNIVISLIVGIGVIFLFQQKSGI